MANLSTSAIEGLRTKGYSQAQIDAIAKAAQTGGTIGAQKAVADIGTVTPTVIKTVAGSAAPIAPAKPTATQVPLLSTTQTPVVTKTTAGSTAPITPAKPTATQVPVTTTATTTPPITQAQLDSLTPTQKAQVKALLASGDKTGAQKAAISFVTAPKPSATATIPSSTPGATPAVTSVNAIRKKNIPSAIKTETKSPAETNDLLKQSEAQLAETKRSTLIDEKNKDVSAAQRKLNEGISVIKSNSEAVRKLYGVDAEGNVDMANTNSLAYKIQSNLDNFRSEKNKLLSGQESSQLNQVQGTLRQTLASRGMDASNVSPELIMSLSGELGIKAFDNIAKLRESTVNSILAEEKTALKDIADLRTKGLASENDAKVAVETLRSSVEESIRAVNKQFANDVIGVATGEVTRKKTASSDLVNSVTKFGTSLGLSGTGLAAVNSYLSKFPDATDAVQSMLKDLSNTSSALYKAVGEVEAEKLKAAQSAYDLKKIAADADLIRARASEESASKKAEKKLSQSLQAQVFAALPASATKGLSISDMTPDWFDYAVANVDGFRDKISGYTYEKTSD